MNDERKKGRKKAGKNARTREIKKDSKRKQERRTSVLDSLTIQVLECSGFWKQPLGFVGLLFFCL